MVRLTVRVSVGLVLFASACGKETPPPFDDGAEVVPADPPTEVPGHPIAARYWGEIDPMSGRIEIFRLGPGNVIHRGQHQEAVTYNGGGTASLTSQLALTTDQTQVSYKDSGGTCHSNGMNVDCSTLSTACNATRVFCAPIAMTSSATFALPDVVLQISQNMPTNAVTGCVDSGDTGLCFASGACSPASSNADKVDCGTSSFSSPIPGNGSTTHGCSWCYGAASKVGSLPGLKHAVMPGSSTSLKDIDTTKLAMVLTNDAKTLVTITVRFSTPAVDSGAAQCGTRGTTMTIIGGGYGPPDACFGDPPASCPISGSPHTGYQFLFPQHGGGTVTGTSISWSDVAPSATVPLNSAHTGNIQMVTPVSPNGTLNVSYKSCPTLSLSVTSGPSSGTSVTFTGNGWLVNGGAGEGVTLMNTPGQLMSCGGITADTSGHWTKTCTIKCSGGGCGANVVSTVTATGGTSTDTATATFTFTS